jgi:hypothetical protein
MFSDTLSSAIYIVGITVCSLMFLFGILFIIGVSMDLYARYVTNPRIERRRRRNIERLGGRSFEESFERLKNHHENIDTDDNAQKLGLKVYTD